MLAYSISNQAKFRMDVLKHFDIYGLASTKQAFKVSKATVYRWRRVFKQTEGKLSSLVPNSTRPKTVRQMTTDLRILEFIKRLRQLHYRIGKDKIKPLLDCYCLALGIKTLSTSTVGKIIKRHRFYYQPREVNRIYHNPSWRYTLKKISYKSKVKRSPSIVTSGYIEIDTIALWVDRIKAYVYQAIDIQNRFAFAYTYSNLNSLNTVDFLDKLNRVYPVTNGIKTIQTDNGLEFMGVFDKRLSQDGIKHLFIYPRCPKINGFIERANRSLREEFLNQNQDLITDLSLLNSKLLDHLYWYNTERPHHSLNNMSPINYLLKMHPESQMYVTHTLH